MDERKENILSEIIEEYSKYAEPVGSQYIAESLAKEVSPATIRNEMAELEKMGYIAQPHTSAGRIPTEKGYRYYIENFLEKRKLLRREQDVLEKSFATDPERKFKNLAKGMAEVTQEGVFIAFSKGNLYYTGISNLISHPEFSDYEYACLMSETIDRLDEIILKIFDAVGEDIAVMIGSKSPFGAESGSLLAGVHFEDSHKGLIGLLGPMRMDYQKNYAVMEYARGLIMQNTE